MAHTEQLAQLLKNLVEHFSLEELRTLCFDLGLDYDELRGEVKSAKARELITVMLRQNRLADLATRLRILRPNADWPDVEAISPEERLAWTTATEMQSAADYLAALRDYCASLPYLTLHDIRPPKMLDEVYVPLKARPQPRKDAKDPQGVQDLEGLRQRHEPLSIAEVMRQREQPHVLILGEPGAGKSTLLRQMAERAWDAPEKIGLDAPCLPILIPLRRLAELDGSLEERLHRALTGELALTQDLAKGFFTQWSSQTGANWLLLLDALDEVPTEQRPRLMDWLKRILKTVGASRIVITSRPSGYSPGELDDKLFGHYDLLSFTPEQTGEFARKWFGDKVEHFLKELDRVRARDLRGTPLLLTIAAQVYLEKGTLPERRSALYDQFVGIWLAEAEQRGLRAELGERMCKVAKFGLAKLALAMTEQPGQASETVLSQIAASYLCNALQLSTDEAEADGCRFVQVMARRSGVFTRRGDKYDFIHPTFREYLAAWTVMQECQHKGKYDLGQVWEWAISRWADENWREVALFALGILSDAEQDVTALVRRAGREGEEGLRFAVIALAEQLKIETSLRDGIVDAVLTRARKEQRWDSITLLGELHGYPRAGKGLLALARDEKVNTNVRVDAARALARLGWAEEAASILLALACDEKVEAVLRLHVAEVLSDLGQAEEAVSIMLALACDEKLDWLEHMFAVGALERLGRTEDLLVLASDEKVKVNVRERAAEALSYTGRAGEAVLILLAMARDEKVEADVRGRAAAALGHLRHTEEATPILSALARDETVDVLVRGRAAAALGILGWAEEAAAILLALARDEKVDVLMRGHAAKALGHLKRADDLLALARDEKVAVLVRLLAAEALWQLGRAEEAVSLLLALALDKKVESSGRHDALFGLGQFADTRVLPDLDRIAQEDKDEDTRRVAQAAIEWIRRRSGTGVDWVRNDE